MPGEIKLTGDEPLCKDCAHFRPSLFDRLVLWTDKYAKCGAAPYDSEAIRLTRLVTGKNPKLTQYFYCTTERGSRIGCGPSGKNFQPR